MAENLSSLDRNVITLWYKEGEAEGSLEPINRFGNAQRAEQLLLQRARTLIFIKAFKAFFGDYNQGLNDTLDHEIRRVGYLREDQKFISPAAYEGYYITTYLPRAPASPLPPFPKTGTPRQRFLWTLWYDCPGKFLWKAGRSDAFSKWLKQTPGGFTDLPANSEINCWEMVFYAAIKSDFVDIEIISPAYDEKLVKARAKPGSSGELRPTDLLWDDLDNHSKSHIGGGFIPSGFDRKASLHQGDIIVTPEKLNGDVKDKMNHVMAIITPYITKQDLEKPAVKPEVLQDVTVMQLWGRASGHMTTYPTTLDLALTSDVENEGKFFTIALQGYD